MKCLITAALGAAFSMPALAQDAGLLPVRMLDSKSSVEARISLLPPVGISHYAGGALHPLAVLPEGVLEGHVLFDAEDRLAGISFVYGRNVQGVTQQLRQAGYRLDPKHKESFAPDSAWLRQGDAVAEIDMPPYGDQYRVSVYSAGFWSNYRALPVF